MKFIRKFFDIYGGDCAGDLADHVCEDCPDVSKRELGRVRSSGFIFSDYLAAILANPLDLSTWIVGIQTKKIIVVPETSGSFEPGDPKALPGYGDRIESNGPRTMLLKFNDPSLAANYDFYNSLLGQTQLVPFFRTSSKLRIFDLPASVFANDPVADDIESEVVWNVSAKVVSLNLPQYHDVATLLKTVFNCAYLNSIIAGDVEVSFDTILDFTADTEDTKESVTGVAAAISAILKFAFNKITAPVGLPNDMTIKVGVTEKLVITFKAEYLGKPFKFTDTTGTDYTGVFTNGTVTF